MGLSANTMRGLTRYLPGTKREGAAVPLLVVYPEDVTPVYESLFIRPTEVPSGTLVDGSYWHDDDDHTLAWFNGTDNLEALHTGSTAQTKAGNLTVTGTLTSTAGFSGGGSRVVKTGAATLTSADSGALCIFNAAAGFLYTLPAAAAGLWFEFVVQTTATSLVHRVACAAADFMLGTILQGQPSTFTQTARTADGSTHLAWEGNGSTKGGIIGDHFWVVAISATQWEVFGTNTATGTTATPFVTS